MQRHIRRRRGITVVWAAITLTVLLMFVGLALDAGYVHITGHQLQNAADAAALAGAAKVGLYRVGVATPQDAVNDAVATAAANQAAQASVLLDPGADVTLGSYDRGAAVFTPGGSPLNACRVTARRTAGSPGGALPLLFAPIFGFNTSDVSRQAIAMTGGTLGAGMIALHPTRQGSFSLNGNISVNVVGGSIQVNSEHPSAATSVSGSAGQIIADQLRIYGGISTSGSPQLPQNLYTNTSPVPDPLAALPAPNKADYVNHGSLTVNGNRTVNAEPGYYPGGINMVNGTLNLAPGIYLLGPGGLTANGGTINAPGVMFYFTTGNNPSQYGRLDLGGNVILHQTPPTSGPWAGISMFADRTAPYPNNPNAVNSLIGNSASTLSGTLYFPSTPLSIGGTSSQFANQIIASTIEVSGNGSLTVNYDGRNTVEINNVFLVK